MSNYKRKKKDRIGKPGEAEAFEKGAQSGGPSLSEAWQGIKSGFGFGEEEKKKKKYNKLRQKMGY